MKLFFLEEIVYVFANSVYTLIQVFGILHLSHNTARESRSVVKARASSKPQGCPCHNLSLIFLPLQRRRNITDFAAMSDHVTPEDQHTPTASPTSGPGERHAARRAKAAIQDEDDQHAPIARPAFGLGERDAARQAKAAAGPASGLGEQNTVRKADDARKAAVLKHISEGKNKYFQTGQQTQVASSSPNENLQSQMTRLFLEMEKHFKGKKEDDWAEAELIAKQLILWPELPIYYRTRAHIVSRRGSLHYSSTD